MPPKRTAFRTTNGERALGVRTEAHRLRVMQTLTWRLYGLGGPRHLHDFTQVSNTLNHPMNKGVRGRQRYDTQTAAYPLLLDTFVETPISKAMAWWVLPASPGPYGYAWEWVFNPDRARYEFRGSSHVTKFDVVDSEEGWGERYRHRSVGVLHCVPSDGVCDSHTEVEMKLKRGHLDVACTPDYPCETELRTNEWCSAVCHMTSGGRTGKGCCSGEHYFVFSVMSETPGTFSSVPENYPMHTVNRVMARLGEEVRSYRRGLGYCIDDYRKEWLRVQQMSGMSSDRSREEWKQRHVLMTVLDGHGTRWAEALAKARHAEDHTCSVYKFTKGYCA